METKFQTSFIPKKSLSPTGGSEAHRYYTRNILSVIGVTIFILAALVYVALFGYTKYIEGQIETMDKKLTETKSQFDPKVLGEFERLDRKISTVKKVISQHTAPSLFFRLLESTTLQGVRFSNLNYTMSADGNISVSASGEAKSYATLALQSDIFAKNVSFKQTSFSDFDLNEKGNVIFKLQTSINTASLLYSKAILISPTDASS